MPDAGDPTTTLYLVRHGETDCNRHGIVQGRGVDSRLNDRGRRQAQCLARRLASVPFDAIYASTLRRARETAQAVAAHHEGVPLHVHADLCEMAWGVYEGVPAEDVREALDAARAAWRDGRFDRCVEGGESIRDVQRRALRAVRRIVAEHAGQTVLVVAHGRWLRVLLASILDEEYGLERMHAIRHANTCVNLVVHRTGCFDAQRLNCIAHLDALDSALTD